MSEWGEEMYGVDPWREKASWIHGGKNDGPDLRREKTIRIHGGKKLRGSTEGKCLRDPWRGKDEVDPRRPEGSRSCRAVRAKGTIR